MTERITPTDVRLWGEKLTLQQREMMRRLADQMEAIDYALSQVWVPKEVAQAVLPLVVAEIALEKEFVKRGSLDNHTATWRALADALAEGVK